MRPAMIAAATMLLAGCPYRTQIYQNTSAQVMSTDGEGKFGTRMGIDKASNAPIDLATLAADCDTGVIYSIDEVRGFSGFNIFTGSHRSLEVWCAVAEPAAPVIPAATVEP